MQKYLRLLNLRLDVVVKDVVCKGEINPEKLASFRHGNCKKSEQEIAKALQSNGRKDLVFALTHEYELYQIFQGKISECDQQIQKLLNEQINNDDNKKQHHIDGKVHKRINKNSRDININLLSYQYFEGVDLLAIEGVSHSTVLTL